LGWVQGLALAAVFDLLAATESVSLPRLTFNPY
jgi:hypothetical protein